MDGNHARALLGLPAHATTEQIRRAFRGAAFVAHPDRGGDAAAFRALLRARDALLAGCSDHHRPSGPFAERFTAPPRPTVDLVDVRRPAPVSGPAPAGPDFDDVLAAVLAEAA